MQLLQAEIARLQAALADAEREREDVMRQHEFTHKRLAEALEMVNGVGREFDRLNARLATLTAWIEKAEHHADCESREENEPCSCGLYAMQAMLDAPTGEGT